MDKIVEWTVRATASLPAILGVIVAYVFWRVMGWDRTTFLEVIPVAALTMAQLIVRQNLAAQKIATCRDELLHREVKALVITHPDIPNEIAEPVKILDDPP